MSSLPRRYIGDIQLCCEYSNIHIYIYYNREYIGKILASVLDYAFLFPYDCFYWRGKRIFPCGLLTYFLRATHEMW